MRTTTSDHLFFCNLFGYASTILARNQSVFSQGSNVFLNSPFHVRASTTILTGPQEAKIRQTGSPSLMALICDLLCLFPILLLHTWAAAGSTTVLILSDAPSEAPRLSLLTLPQGLSLRPCHGSVLHSSPKHVPGPLLGPSLQPGFPS